MSKFWIYDVTELIKSVNIIPRSDETLAEKLNALMRLAIIVCILIAIFSPILAISTFLLSVIILTSAFFAYQGAPKSSPPTDATWGGEGMHTFTASPLDAHTACVRENFQPCDTAGSMFGQNEPTAATYHPSSSSSAVAGIGQTLDANKPSFPFTTGTFCNDTQPLQYNDSYYSANQSLAGCANPKTYIPPIVAVPSHELAGWKASDLTTHSAVNTSTNYDVYRSGYSGASFDPANITYSGGSKPNGKCTECSYTPCMCDTVRSIKARTRTGHDKRRDDLACTENSGGYDLTVDSTMDRVLTQTLQPGVYQRSMMDEPINANIGISWVKPFDPMMIEDSDVDGVKYTALNGCTALDKVPTGDAMHRRNLLHARTNERCRCSAATPPNANRRRDDSPDNGQRHHLLGTVEPYTDIDLEPQGEDLRFQHRFRDHNEQSRRRTTNDLNSLLESQKYYMSSTTADSTAQTEDNIFDPRFTGYGSNDRAYVDRVTGQPRFFYDDIDAIKMPNYVTRNNVDVFPWAQTYGPDVGIEYGDGYKQRANNAFLDSTLKLRTELQERLMRKRNAELWQRRVAPIPNTSSPFREEYTVAYDATNYVRDGCTATPKGCFNSMYTAGYIPPVNEGYVYCQAGSGFPNEGSSAPCYSMCKWPSYPRTVQSSNMKCIAAISPI